MDRKWPFGFFIYGNSEKTEDALQAEPETVEAAEAAEDEVKDTAEAASEMEEVSSKIGAEAAEDTVDADDFDGEEDEEDLPDLEEELEIALEEAHQEEVKKHRLIKGVTAGVAILGVVGLATGFAIHNHFKKK